MKRQLRISLYPLIPDSGEDSFRGYLRRMKTEFESSFSDIELQLQIGMEHNTSDSKYLTKVMSENLVDAVEIDSMMLSHLTDNNWALPLDENHTTHLNKFYYPQSLQSFQFGDTAFGLPTALCSCFLFSRHPEIKQATNLDELLAILGKLDQSLPKVMGFLVGTGVIPIFYYLFQVGRQPNTQVEPVLQKNIDLEIVNNLHKLVSDCFEFVQKQYQVQIQNFKPENQYWALDEYLAGNSHSYLGFSENLYHLLKNNQQEIHYTPALFGEYRPVLFANGLVINKTGVSEQRIQDVIKFAKYYSDLETLKWRTFSQDNHGLPRYILPPRKDFFALEEVAQDQHLNKFKGVLEDGVIMANQGYVENKEIITRQIYQHWGLINQ